jgi:hypothetical protein
MNKLTKIAAGVAITAALIYGGVIIAADHLDAPAVNNKSTDITDVYVFRGQDPSNLVFVANTQGFIAPSATAAAKFDPNTMLEFNIDNNGDNIEDLVIQAIADGDRMRIYGPIAPSEKGNRSKAEGNLTFDVNVTPYGSAPLITSSNGIRAFAGPRDDPFFFDLNRFRQILGGTATGFNNPGNDTFAGTNVLSLVIEVPKSLLNATNNKLNVWLETKTKI